MKKRRITHGTRRKLLRAIQDSPTYRRAHKDPGFMEREELRPIRMHLEILRPEMELTELDIRSTIVVFGSARIKAPEEALENVVALRRRLKSSPRDKDLQAKLASAQRLLARSRYYTEARKFASIVTRASQADKKRDFVIVTGGGPGIMEAANRGAWEAGGKSAGLNITLPHEQVPNPYITPELSFRFHYFAMRKMHFLMRAKAMVAFPGGFGTFDELFETLTLVQTKKKHAFPILLFGKEYWTRVVSFKALAREGVIGHKDLDLIRYVESAEEAWDVIRRYWERRGGLWARKRRSIISGHLDEQPPTG
ncbi:MAG: TIGR00730 family Rossman fold protein [Elusimicrobiota bacterium]